MRACIETTFRCNIYPSVFQEPNMLKGKVNKLFSAILFGKALYCIDGNVYQLFIAFRFFQLNLP